MTDIEAVLDEAGLKNDRVCKYVRYWPELAGAARIELISAEDDPRLIQEPLQAGGHPARRCGPLILA